MRRLRDNIWLQLMVIYTRYLIGGAFVFASIIKIKGERFTSGSGAKEPINSAFHFFETMYESGLYWKFIGVGQLLAGFLLMTQRYAKLGAVANFPIILNVFVITISYSFGFTSFIVGLMLMANICLLIWEWDELKSLLNLPYVLNERNLERYRIWQVTGYLLFCFTFIYRVFVDRYDFILWSLVCLVIGFTGLVFGIKKIVLIDSKEVIV